MADLYDATDMVDPNMVSPKATWKPGWGDAEFQEQRAVVRKLVEVKKWIPNWRIVNDCHT